MPKSRRCGSRAAQRKAQARNRQQARKDRQLQAKAQRLREKNMRSRIQALDKLQRDIASGRVAPEKADEVRRDIEIKASQQQVAALTQLERERQQSTN